MAHATRQYSDYVANFSLNSFIVFANFIFKTNKKVKDTLLLGVI